MRPATDPFQATGGLKSLDGNLGRGIMKVSAVASERHVIEAPARVFEDQESVKAAFKAVKGVRPGMIPMSIDALINEFSGQIDPFWAQCQESSEAPRAFFSRNDTVIANAK